MAPEYEVPAWLEDPEATPVIPPPKPGIQQLRQPSKFTCLPTAFAMVLAKRHPAPVLLLGDILHQLGRDDERGFHVQELLGIALTLKVVFTPFEQKPDMERAPCMDQGCWRGGVRKTMNGEEFQFTCTRCEGTGEEPLPTMILPKLADLLRDYDGVLLGNPKSDKDRYHAVAWCHETQKCLDPDGPVYDIEQFEVDTFWAAFRMERD